jgi:hypothetical protein
VSEIVPFALCDERITTARDRVKRLVGTANVGIAVCSRVGHETRGWQFSAQLCASTVAR